MPDLSSGPPAAAAAPCRILLVAALPRKCGLFCACSRARRRRGLPWPAWEFALGAVRGLLALSGMGARGGPGGGARLVAQFRPHLLVSLGFGGALSPELPPGALVLGESFYKFDPATGVLDPMTPAPALAAAHAGTARVLDRRPDLPPFPAVLITTPYIIHKGRTGGA